MAKTTAPPSRISGVSSARRRPVAGRPPVDVRAWLGGIRLSGFMVIMMGLVVLAAFVLVPTIGTFVDQRQQVTALEAAVQLSRDEVAELESQRERWEDPAYITTQARERLYYVKPGEVVYLVDDDLPPELEPQEQQPVSDELEAAEADWMSQLVRSATEAGLAQAGAPLSVGVPDPDPASTRAP